LVFIGRDIIRSEEKLIKSEWQRKLKDFNLQIQLDWNDVQEIFKTLKRKYLLEKDHTDFRKYYKKSRIQYHRKHYDQSNH